MNKSEIKMKKNYEIYKSLCLEKKLYPVTFSEFTMEHLTRIRKIKK